MCRNWQARQRIAELENLQAPRAQGEAAVQKSQQLLQAFLDNFPDGACIKDSEGHISLANRKMEEALPVPGGIIGKTNYDLMPKEVADATWASEKRVLETREATKVEELDVLLMDEPTNHLDLTSAQVMERAGAFPRRGRRGHFC